MSWRGVIEQYRDYLPVTPQMEIITLLEGNTPLIPVPRFVDAIYTHLVGVREDGSLRLNIEYFDFLRSLRMTNSKFDRLFGGPPRQPETPVEQRHMDVARSIQVVTANSSPRVCANCFFTSAAW